MSEIYTVVLLVEQALSDADAVQVRSLHQELVEEQEALMQLVSMVGAMDRRRRSGA